MPVGIDYGMGCTNRDPENGIRFGVISQNSVSQAWSDSAEPDYGKPTCPKCQSDAMEYLAIHEPFEQYRAHGCADYACEDCEITFDSSEAFPDEPQGWSYKNEGYDLTDYLDSDIFVVKSPYYTHTQFCSPCVPGAGNLNSPDTDGVKTYCLDHDWFENGKAPYPVYDVATDALVEVERAS